MSAITQAEMTQPLVVFRRQATSLLRDYAELMKLRVTTLIVMTAWCGYYFGAQKAGFLRCPGDCFTPCWESGWSPAEPPR